MERSFRRLLPSLRSSEAGQSSSQSQPPDSSSSLLASEQRRQRTNVTAACEECRRRKAKCDAQRPRCSRCIRRGTECIYHTAEGETPALALRRERQTLREQFDQLRGLYSLIHERSYSEAYEIFNRIRRTDDPLAVLEAIKSADLLLPSIHTENYSDPRLRNLDAEALGTSFIKVPARPWTTVAGDGLVSELISSFFRNDHGYLVPMIHRGSFIKQMRAFTVPEPIDCSRTLVNAICAFKSLTSHRATTIGWLLGQSMTEQFLTEAKRQYELEYDRQSITTVIALCLIYHTSALLRKDRSGQMYRFTAYETLKRLRIEHRFTTLNENNPTEARLRRIYSKSLWGLFCFEGRMAYFYSEPALIRLPSIPNLFDEKTRREDEDEELDLSFDSLYRQVPGLFDALCRLSELFYEIMTYNAMGLDTSSSAQDSLKRADLYAKLKSWHESLPQRLQPGHNFTAHTCYLQLHISEAYFGIFQLLPPKLHFQEEELSIGELCINLCATDADVIERYMKLLTPDPLLGRSLFISLTILTPLLDDDNIHDVFTRDCLMLRACMPVMPLANGLLKSIQALALTLQKSLPEAALKCFEGLDSVEQVKDLPISFTIPHRHEIRSLLAGNGGDDSNQVGVRLSELISRWPDLTLDESRAARTISGTST